MCFINFAFTFVIQKDLKGHRTTGGMRASIYNAMDIDGCKALALYMKVAKYHFTSSVKLCPNLLISNTL